MLCKIERLSLLTAFGLLCLSPFAHAGELQPGSLRWPLWELTSAGTYADPRLGATNAMGNFQGGDYDQAYLDRPVDQRDPYLHPGVDIRGANGDVVVAPAAGDIWLTNADSDFCPHRYDSTGRSTANTQCRIYLLDPQKRYVYYFSHIDYAVLGGAAADNIRTAIENARSKQDSYDGTRSESELLATAANTRVNREQVIGLLADFPSYHHTHFAIYDLSSNFDMLDPLKYLESRPASNFDFLDTDQPVVRDLYLEEEAAIAGQGARVTLTGTCHEIHGGKYDIIANMDDTINAARMADTGEEIFLNAAHRARVIIQRAHGARDEREWYDFDHLPLQCAGNWKNGSCPATNWQTFFDINRFSKASLADDRLRTGVLGTQAGAIIRDKLFAFGTKWWASQPEPFKYLHVLTHSWGEDGNWDGDAAPDGLYYITGEIEDAGGSKAARTLQVVLNKQGTPLGPDLVGDMMVRDRPDDTGATPSGAGGQPFWTSPDIIIRLWADRDSVTSASDIDAVSPYEPYVAAGENTPCSFVCGTQAVPRCLASAGTCTRPNQLRSQETGRDGIWAVCRPPAHSDQALPTRGCC